MSDAAAPRPEPPAMDDVAAHPVLAGLDETQAREVLAHARVSRLDAGETLFHEGDPGRAFFLVRHGQLKLFRIGQRGNEKIVGLIDAGDTFAEAVAFMQEHAYPVHCEAIEASEVVGFDTTHLVELLRSAPDVSIRLLGMLSQRLRQRVADIDALSLQNAQLRVVNYILQLHDRAGERAHLPTSKKQIASVLAVQPETLSRVLAQLQQQGVIEVDRRDFLLRDRAALEAIATGQRAL